MTRYVSKRIDKDSVLALVPPAGATRPRAVLVIGLLCAALLVAIPACGRGGPTAPSPPIVPESPLPGRWSGTMDDSVDGRGRLNVAITQHVAISLLGGWTSHFDDESLNDHGPVTGSVDGATVRLTLQSTRRLCPPGLVAGGATPLLTATLTRDDDRMTGDYVALRCGSVSGGRLVLERE